MSHEKIEQGEKESAHAEMMATPGEVESRLLELGWTREQVGKFASIIEAMVDKVIRGSADGADGGVHVELSTVTDEEGEDTAEVTITGEGAGLGPRQIAELIDREELPVMLLTEASTEFFPNQNKVILRRKKDRAPETDVVE